jgi:hypothetical protein
MAFQSIIMDLSVWESTVPSMKKVIISVIENVIAVHPAREHNLSAINSGLNPISRILRILGNEGLDHGTVMDFTHLLGVFVPLSSNSDDFAMVCDSALAAVQTKRNGWIDTSIQAI